MWKASSESAAWQFTIGRNFASKQVFNNTSQPGFVTRCRIGKFGRNAQRPPAGQALVLFIFCSSCGFFAQCLAQYCARFSEQRSAHSVISGDLARSVGISGVTA